jgi:hypothetical protein
MRITDATVAHAPARCCQEQVLLDETIRTAKPATLALPGSTILHLKLLANDTWAFVVGTLVVGKLIRVLQPMMRFNKYSDLHKMTYYFKCISRAF